LKWRRKQQRRPSAEPEFRGLGQASTLFRLPCMAVNWSSLDGCQWRRQIVPNSGVKVYRSG
jgi:hypothetical protein